MKKKVLYFLFFKKRIKRGVRGVGGRKSEGVMKDNKQKTRGGLEVTVTESISLHHSIMRGVQVHTSVIESNVHVV